jgi:hypothetical protein
MESAPDICGSVIDAAYHAPVSASSLAFLAFSVSRHKMQQDPADVILRAEYPPCLC